MSSPAPAFRGAIFDWDGVIIDSHAQHEAAWEELARELGQPLPPGFFKKTFGMRNDRIIPEFTPWVPDGDSASVARLGERKETLYRQILRRDGIAPLPGVLTLLRELQSHGIPCAVGSSTSLENIRTIMEMTGLEPFFAGICAEKDVRRGKPDPEVFLAAATKIGRHPADCVVFEDAMVGLQAARAAGSRAVAVATTHPASSFAGQADLVVDTLQEITVPSLRRLWEPAPAASDPR